MATLASVVKLSDKLVARVMKPDNFYIKRLSVSLATKMAVITRLFNLKLLPMEPNGPIDNNEFCRASVAVSDVFMGKITQHVALFFTSKRQSYRTEAPAVVWTSPYCAKSRVRNEEALQETRHAIFPLRL